MSGKYSPVMLAARQEVLGHAKQSVTDAFKTASKRAIQKIEVTGDLTGNKIANKITKLSKKFTTKKIRDSYKWEW